VSQDKEESKVEDENMEEEEKKQGDDSCKLESIEPLSHRSGVLDAELIR